MQGPGMAAVSHENFSVCMCFAADASQASGHWTFVKSYSNVAGEMVA